MLVQNQNQNLVRCLLNCQDRNISLIDSKLSHSVKVTPSLSPVTFNVSQVLLWPGTPLKTSFLHTVGPYLLLSPMWMWLILICRNRVFSCLLRYLSASLWQCPTHTSEHTKHAQWPSDHVLLSTQQTTETCYCFQSNQQTSYGMTYLSVKNTKTRNTCKHIKRYTSFFFSVRCPSPITGSPPPTLPNPSLCPFRLDCYLLPSGVTWTPSCTCLAPGCLMLLS